MKLYLQCQLSYAPFDILCMHPEIHPSLIGWISINSRANYNTFQRPYRGLVCVCVCVCVEREL